MKIVVDTNIIFSALLNTSSNIGDILFNSDGIFEFYSCIYMQYEIKKHWSKLKRISKLTEKYLQISYLKILSKLHFVDEEVIPVEIWLDSAEIVKDIDEDDVDFVALTKFLKASLWTGDKFLYKGLSDVKFKKVINTSDIIKLRSTKLKY